MADDDQKDRDTKNPQAPESESEQQASASDFSQEMNGSDKASDADEPMYQASDDDEEYQFEDIEGLGTDSDSYTDDSAFLNEAAEEGVASPPGRGRFDSLDPKMLKVIRNGAFAIGGLVVIVILYKYVLSFFGGSSQQDTSQKIMPKTTAVKPEKQSPLPIYGSTTTTVTSQPKDDSNLSALKQDQARLDNEVTAIRSQLNTVSQQVIDISSKMEDIKQTMLVLSERLERQSQQMARINTVNRTSVRRAESNVPRPAKPVVEKTVFYIQAVIPGRAWLKSNDGKTITVSRGTMVPGYGAVRTINPKLGRVYTSSGRIIRFDQADS